MHLQWFGGPRLAGVQAVRMVGLPQGPDFLFGLFPTLLSPRQLRLGHPELAFRGWHTRREWRGGATWESGQPVLRH